MFCCRQNQESQVDGLMILRNTAHPPSPHHSKIVYSTIESRNTRHGRPNRDNQFPFNPDSS